MHGVVSRAVDWLSGLTVALSIVAVGLLATGCSSSSEPSSSSTNAASPTVEAVQLVTASDYATALKTAIPSVTKITVIDENNDPNNLIGRPNGYTSAATLFDKRVSGRELGVDNGASIEVFTPPAAAKQRFAYIDSIQKSMSMIHDYMMLSGNVLVRVSGDLKPSQYEAYEEALTTFTGRKPDAIA